MTKTHGKVYVIPNGIDASFFNIQYKEKKNRMLYVGYVEPRKGVYKLVKAIEEIKDSISAIKLIIVVKITDIEYYNKIKLFVASKNLNNNVIFKGSISKRDLIKEYQFSSIFVLPSVLEPFGIVLLEAMASKKPVIATKTGGIPYVVKDKRTGFLFDGSIHDLANKILILLNNDSLRKKMGEKGQEIAKKYKWNYIVEETLKLYERILREGH